MFKKGDLVYVKEDIVTNMDFWLLEGIVSHVRRDNYVEVTFNQRGIERTYLFHRTRIVHKLHDKTKIKEPSIYKAIIPFLFTELSVQTYKPDWSIKECLKWLMENEDGLNKAMERGGNSFLKRNLIKKVKEKVKVK